MYYFSFSKALEKILSKLNKKNKVQFEIVLGKIEEIVETKNADHYKNLRKPLQHLKRVHIDNSFVLVFHVNEAEKHIIFEDFDHHDNIYRK